MPSHCEPVVKSRSTIVGRKRKRGRAYGDWKCSWSFGLERFTILQKPGSKCAKVLHLRV
jgi:hypothetical protein